LKILVSWLRELVDVPVTPAKLASDLHMAGFEVASVEPPPGGPADGNDAVIDLEITANRPDCLSVLGIAREVATLYDTLLKMPSLATLGAADGTQVGGLRVTIEDPERCPRYCGAVADVRIAPSPPWMQQRLAAAGVRAINNIVDITNYVLLELGHPMHAFDFGRLGGHELRIRTARTGERVTTLDGQDRALVPDILVIADATRPQAIGGVMGGGDSEVSATTHLIALESAWFEPTAIRRTSKRLGLSTEASYRFERGADIEAPPVALARACALLEETGAGHALPGFVDAYPAQRGRTVVALDTARVTQVLGADVPTSEITRTLEGLGFGVVPQAVTADQPSSVSEPAGHGTCLSVTVPSWRIDVGRDVDLIEEIARHFGYDRLPTTFPTLEGTPAEPDGRLQRDRLVRRLAASAGFAEAVTFSFIERGAALSFATTKDLVDILNPLSEQFAVLRPSLLPGIVDAVAHNLRRGQEDARLFELGTVFNTRSGERRQVALAWVGAGSPRHWSGSGRPVDFFDMTGAVELIAAGLGAAVELRPAERPYLLRGRAAAVLVAGGDADGAAIGVVGQLAPALTAGHDMPLHAEVYVAEVDLDALTDVAASRAMFSSVPPPRHPAVVRDISIIVDDTLPAARVRGTIHAAAPATLVRVREFDRYQGKGVPEGRVSLSYRFTFQAPDRTLTDADVQRAMTDIVQALIREHGAVQR
jgi:phenylalanyl-tRNA synthetase beta chain